MTTPTWAPGTLYQPGDIVLPRSLSSTAQVPPDDPGFESGALGDWSETAVGGSASGAVSSAYHFEGTKSYLWAGGAGSGQGGGIGVDLVNDFRAPVVPGQSITATCYCMSVPLHREHHVHSHVRIYWYDESDVFLSYTDSVSYGGLGNQFGTTGAWVKSTITGVAPAGAAFASIGAFLTSNQGDDNGAYVDGFSWNYVASTLPDGLVFRAVQAESGFSDASEPVWPVVNGATVVDNEVTWEAVFGSRVVWTAAPVLKSGSVEPTFPTVPGGTVVDNAASASGIVWVAMDNRVKDAKCPNTKEVIIAASKVFAADQDIIPFSATVNPLDWSTEGDAGYLPFGLQTYGATPVSALGLYRSNLIAANSKGYQMWQVDEDPANMALLDASPVDCPYSKSMQPVSNDLVFETSQGIRNIGIAGASTNLQAGFFGKQIDPLVKAARAAIDAGDESRGLFYPGAGQYWLFFGPQAFVLTMNGGPDDMSWSRYVYPYDIDDWTIHDAKLYLRAGTLIWEVSEDALADDYFCEDLDVPTLSGEVQEDITTALLSWTEVEGADGYRLYDADTDELIIETDDLTKLAEGLENDTLYSFYVTAFDAIFETAHSNTVTLDTGHPLTVVEIYNTPGAITWTKRPGLVSVDIVVRAAGGGGSAGRWVSGDAAGGHGGGGGEVRTMNVLAAALSSTETVTVGDGGPGGVGDSSGVGADGTDGGNSSFGAHCVAIAGAGAIGISPSVGGAAGNTLGNVGGTGGTGGSGVAGKAGGDAGVFTAATDGADAGATTASPGGGGGGGGPVGGGAGGTGGDGPSGTPAGGTAGTTGLPPVNGGAGSDSATNGAGSGGGGGGGPNGSSGLKVNRTGGKGGHGGKYGAGGAGGGGGYGTGVDGTAASGDGGDGAQGIVIVTNNLS